MLACALESESLEYCLVVEKVLLALDTKHGPLLFLFYLPLLEMERGGRLNAQHTGFMPTFARR